MQILQVDIVAWGTKNNSYRVSAKIKKKSPDLKNLVYY